MLRSVEVFCFGTAVLFDIRELDERPPRLGNVCQAVPLYVCVTLDSCCAASSFLSVKD